MDDFAIELEERHGDAELQRRPSALSRQNTTSSIGMGLDGRFTQHNSATRWYNIVHLIHVHIYVRVFPVNDHLRFPAAEMVANMCWSPII